MRIAARPLPQGRYPAPPMVEHDRHGEPLDRPYPLARRWARGAVALAALAMVAAVPRGNAGWALLVGAVTVALLPALIVRMPRPAFLTLGRQQAHTLEPHSWIRLRGGYAVQVLNVHVRKPATTGDPTPPKMLVRCSDDETREFRPHDVLHVVQPVDL